MPQEPPSVAYDRLRHLTEELAGGSAWTDEEILAEVDGLGRRLRTNCEAAAEGLFVAIAPICRHRPRLVGPLMRRALRPLAFLGCERADQVREFVDWFLAQPSTYLPLGPVGRAWLASEFPEHLEVVQQLLDELVREADTGP